MTQDYWKELVERYFEADTTPEEELALREFLARTSPSDWSSDVCSSDL